MIDTKSGVGLRSDIGKLSPIRAGIRDAKKRLAIIVPYRARQAHLGAFVPALRAYFTRDKLDREIAYRVLIVEQSSGLPFNRGALLNVGFQLCSGKTDYVCLHDVDYLPIWADYSWSDVPVCIVWYGAEERPILPGRSDRTVKNDLAMFFGAVVLMPNSLFAQVNGYANSYWGWGYEDDDLRHRLTRSGIQCGRRWGTFQPLDHDNLGFGMDGAMTPTGLANQRIWRSRWVDGTNNEMQSDGLKTLSYEIIDRQTIPTTPEERPASWEKITVRLLMQPSPEQLEATERTAPGLA
jgi:hypothetical protein